MKHYRTLCYPQKERDQAVGELTSHRDRLSPLTPIQRIVFAWLYGGPSDRIRRTFNRMPDLKAGLAYFLVMVRE